MPRRGRSGIPLRKQTRVRQLVANGIPPRYVAKITRLNVSAVHRILRGAPRPDDPVPAELQPRHRMPGHVRFDSVDPGDHLGRVGLPVETWPGAR